MITTTKEITDKKQLLLLKQRVEEKLNQLGKNWGYIQKTAQIDAAVLQRFIDLKGITEENLDKIMNSLAISSKTETEQEITPKVEKSEKITPKWDYEKFKNKVLELIMQNGEVRNKDIEAFFGKPKPYWKRFIEQMLKEGVIVEDKIPNNGKGKKYLNVYRVATKDDIIDFLRKSQDIRKRISESLNKKIEKKSFEIHITEREFETLFEERVRKCREVLVKKSKEYSSNNDKMRNFNVTARMMDILPEQAAWMFMMKHFQSVYDIIMHEKPVSKEMWDEKIGDLINYLLLIDAMFTKRLENKS